MSFTERINLIFDVDNAKGVRSFKDLKTSVANADGVMGKFKAGATGLAGVLKENVAAAAIAAATAIVAFGVHAAQVFVRTEVAARELGDAIGTSTEDASRWIGVADDMQVSADQLTTGFGKLAKTLNSGTWEKYGIETRDASGHIRSTNDILLDAFDMLGKVTNETARATIGNALFGKGYANLAPLIGKSRAEYEQMLGAVEAGQVITKDEEKKAEDLRLAQDALSDSWGEVTLALGAFVAELAPLIEALASSLGWIVKTSDALKEMSTNLFLDERVKGLGKAFGEAGVQAEGMAGGVAGAAASLNNLKSLLGELGDVETPFEAASAAVGHMNDVLANSPDDMRAVAAATFEARRAVTDFISTSDLVPEAKKTEIQAMIDRGDWAAVEAALNEVARSRVAVIEVQLGSAAAALGAIGNKAKSIGTSLGQAFGDVMKSASSASGGGGGGGGGGGKTPAEQAEEDAKQWDDVLKYLYQSGQRSLAEYRDYLTGRLAAYDEFSDEWISKQNEIRALDETQADAQKKASDQYEKDQKDRLDAIEKEAEARKKAADEAARAAQDALDEADRLASVRNRFGDLSDEDYEKYLSRRLRAYQKFSAEWVRIEDELEAVKKRAADADAERNKALQGTPGLEQYGVTQHINMYGDMGPQTQQLFEMQARRQRQADLAGVGLK